MIFDVTWDLTVDLRKAEASGLAKEVLDPSPMWSLHTHGRKPDAGLIAWCGVACAMLWCCTGHVLHGWDGACGTQTIHAAVVWMCGMWHVALCGGGVLLLEQCSGACTRVGGCFTDSIVESQ